MRREDVTLGKKICPKNKVEIMLLKSSKYPSKGVLESKVSLVLIYKSNSGMIVYKLLIASILIPSKTIAINNKEFSLSEIVADCNKPFLN